MRAWRDWVTAAVLATVTMTGCAAPEQARSGPNPDGTGKVLVEPGDTGGDIAEALDQAGVVRAEEFQALAAVSEDARSIQPGLYQLKTGITAQEALESLLEPASKASVRMAVNAGDRAAEIAERAARAAGWSISRTQEAFRVDRETGVSSLDGLLGVATYDVLPGDTPESLVKAMVREGRAPVMEAERLATSTRTTRDLLTVASLLHAEVREDDWGKASRAIWNRLERGMRLQVDATTAYAAGVRKLELTAEQLNAASPYNTYVTEGLPPGPIGQVTSEAVWAAANPEPGNWLYWVTVNPDTGETRFAASYDEFLTYKDQYRQWLAR